MVLLTSRKKTMALHKGTTILASMMFLMLLSLPLGPGFGIAAAQESTVSKLRMKNIKRSGIRKKKPPNRRLRRGPVYKNGSVRDQDLVWEDGQLQEPKGDGIISRAEKPSSKQPTEMTPEAKELNTPEGEFNARGWESWHWVALPSTFGTVFVWP